VRLIYAGTPAFAAVALEALLGAGHEIALVLTQPDRPAGRGMQMQPSPVKRLADARGLVVHQPATLREPAAQAPLAAAGADAMVVAAYGLILPPAVLALPRLGCINIHASLLPRWRGAAPIQRALLAGDAETGITIMQMDAGLDTGPMLLAEPLAIAGDDSAGTLHDRLAALGARLVVTALARLERGELVAVAQPADGASYAARIDKREAELDFARPALELERQVRAFDPVPGAVCRLGDVRVKVWRARALALPGATRAMPPGAIVALDDRAIVVATGDGLLGLLELQAAGGRRLDAAAFARGHPLRAGARFECIDRSRTARP
jgi:methionyl-tRNA formyltransferase